MYAPLGQNSFHRPVDSSKAQADAPSAKGERQNAPSTKPQSGPLVEMIEGNLLHQNVDAIVNAWNQNFIPQWMLLTQGVSGAIRKAAGNAPFDELKKFGVIPLGEARLTSSGRLPYKGIIHVAGINYFWRSSEKSVRDSVANALIIAKNEKFSSVAFPAIGAGSSLSLGKGRELPIWGIATQRSLVIIADEAAKSEYCGRVVIIKFKKT